MKHIPASALAALSLTWMANGAQAQIANGGFDQGLIGWSAAGDALVETGRLTLTTAYAGIGDDDTPFNRSGTAAIGIDALEPLLGVQPYALDLGGEGATEGSLATQSFAVAAGQTLHFDWSFSTRETLFQDHAFVVIDGTVFTLATLATAPAARQSFHHGFTQSGLATLAFGVVDTGDFVGVSTLTIDSVQVSAVPEPGTWALMAGGLAVLAARRRAGR